MEVLIAFAIMAMVLAALLPGQAGLLRRADAAEASLLAADLAASRLARAGIEAPLVTGRSEIEWRDWTIVEEVTEAPPVDGVLPVLAIRVEVFSETGTSLARLDSLRQAP